MVIYAVRTTVGREEAVVDRLAITARKKGMPVFSVLFPKEFKGYVLIEAQDLSSIEHLIRGVNHVRGVVRRVVPFSEIEKTLESKAEKIEIRKGDTVEHVSGPFKGQKGRVVRVDKTKREITVESLEAAIPIPITVAIESIRLVKKRGEESE